MIASVSHWVHSTSRSTRRWLAAALRTWGAAIAPEPETVQAPALPPLTKASPPPEANSAIAPSAASEDALCPAVREPLSVENAVLNRDMTLLRREAADALAALGSAHALVTSARLAQVQELRNQVAAGAAPPDALMALAADYQGWQNDQVRLFDALAMVMRMRVPEGSVLDQMDPDLHDQARTHLSALSTEYQRRQLMQRFPSS